MINNLISYSRKKHHRTAAINKDLVPGFIIGVEEGGIITVAGLVTEFQNNLGDGGTPFDFDVIVGTAANLKKSISDAALLYGIDGDSISTPNSVASSVESSITGIAYIIPDDWTPGGLKYILAKWNEMGAQRAYQFNLTATGELRFETSETGTAVTDTSESTVPTGFTDETGHWVAFTWDDVANVSNFFTSDDSPTTPPSDVSWTLLGAANISHISAGIFNSTATFTVGARIHAATPFPVSGSIHRAVVINQASLTAVPAVDFDANLYVNKITDTTFNSDLMAIDLPGGVGDCALTPDAVISPSGSVNIEIIWRCNAVNYGLGRQVVISHWNEVAVDERGWEANFESTGAMRFRYAENGTGPNINIVSTENSPVPNGVTGWFRILIDANNGSSDADVTFFTSLTNTNDPASVIWDQLGDVVNPGAVITIFDSANNINIGAGSDGTSNIFKGSVFRTQIYQGINPLTQILTSDFDASTFVSGSSLTGLKRLDLPGAVGDFVSTPNAVANRITGDFDVQVQVNLPSYAPPSTQTFLSKLVLVGDQRSYWFLLNVFSELELLIYEDGTAGSVVTYRASEIVSVVGKTNIGFRAALDVDNGDSDSECTFYTSTDGFNWTQVGKIIKAGATVTIHPGTAEVELGSTTSGTVNLMTGTMFNAKIFNGTVFG